MRVKKERIIVMNIEAFYEQINKKGFKGDIGHPIDQFFSFIAIAKNF
jgi:hypothetical protein